MMEDQQYPPYPMPEIRIQMRLNIITEGGELSVGPGGQMAYVGAPPQLPAIKSTPHIQQIDTSGDERTRHRHKHKHSKRSKESDGGSRHDKHRHTHRSDDGRSSRSRHSADPRRSQRRHDRHESGETSGTAIPASGTSPDESFGFVPSINQGSTPEFEVPPATQPHIRAITPQPGFSEPEPLDSDPPLEVSFNSNLTSPPEVVPTPTFGGAPEDDEIDPFSAEPKRRLAGYGAGAYRPYRAAPHLSGYNPDQSVDSLEMSLDNRFEAFHGKLTASNQGLNMIPQVTSAQNGSPAVSGFVLHKMPKSGYIPHSGHMPQDQSIHESIASKGESELVSTVKSLLNTFEQPKPPAAHRSSSVSSLVRPHSETEFAVVKPTPRPRHFGSHQNLQQRGFEDEEDRTPIAEQPRPVYRTASQKSIETTFPAQPPVFVQPSPVPPVRPASPTASLTTHNSSYSSSDKPGILKRTVSPGQRSVETTFGVDAGQSQEIDKTRSREDIERELAPMLAGIETKMKGMLLDQDRSLRTAVDHLSEKVRESSDKKLATPDLEKEIKPLFEGLEVKIARIMADRETALSSSVQAAVQASSLQSKVDAMEKETQMKQLEQRLEQMFMVKENAFRASVESMLQNILDQQKPATPPPPPPPEPRAVEERIVKEGPSPKGFVTSVPYKDSIPKNLPMPPPVPPEPDRSSSNLNYSVDSMWSQQRQSYYDVPTPVNVSPRATYNPDLKVYDVPSDASSGYYDVPRGKNIPRPKDFDQRLPLGPLRADTSIRSDSASHTSSPGLRPGKASSAAIFDMYTKRKPPSTVSSMKTDSSLMEENPDDYLLKDHFSPPTLAEAESTTLSRTDSFASETSLRADRSAPFYDQKVVRFRDDNSDIESKLRQMRGSIASTTTTVSDVGIPLADVDDMSDMSKRVIYYEEDIHEQIEYFEQRQNPPDVPTPTATFYSPSGQNTVEVFRSGSSASTTTLTGFGRATTESAKLAKAVMREDPVVIMGDKAMIGIVNLLGTPTPLENSGKSPKPTDL